MHSFKKIACVMWKNKKPVLLLSTHNVPIQAPCEAPVVTVPRRDGRVRKPIQTSPILLEYTTHMSGVDAANQLRASYTCHVRSHKWWHCYRIFFLLDVTVVNMYIIYLDIVANGNPQLGQRTPMTHLQFKQGLCKALLANWPGRTAVPHDIPPAPEDPVIHVPCHSIKRRQCVVCRVAVGHIYCHLCGNKWMCLLGTRCFERYHTALDRRNLLR